MIEKSNALKERYFLELIHQRKDKELRRKYINEYVVAQAPTPTVGTVHMEPRLFGRASSFPPPCSYNCKL